MSMLRHRAARRSQVSARLLYSARSLDDVIYRQELERLATDNLEVLYTLTRAQPPGWTGYARRVDKDMLEEVAFGGDHGIAFVCGPTRFVEAVADGLLAVGYAPERVKTERFGPTGG
jgi:ferredoxin-NADP reductase